jgi:NADH-quinone oxidoreductase subunit N
MNFTIETFLPLLPIILLSITAVVVMLAVSIKRNHAVSYWITIAGQLAALISIFGLNGFAPDRVATPVTDLVLLDGFAYFYSALVILSSLVCTVFLRNFLESYGNNKEEVYMLLLISAVGGLVLVSSSHMAGFFIGLELLSVPLYGMVAYTHERSRSLEAGVKYLILSAAASAFLLFGMALVYAQTGTMLFADIGERFAEHGGYLAGFGIAMIVIAMCFKLSLAPFHLWTPDVYQGAPAPIGALLATASKLAIIAILIRLMGHLPIELSSVLQPVLAVIAIVSIAVGNFLALTQSNLKRLLAYSSIAHMGYLLIALIAGNSVDTVSANVYLLTYVVTSLAAFGVISALSHGGNMLDAEEINHYRGLFWRHPVLAVSMTLIMLSLAGIPLTAGFIGKFYLFMTGVTTGSWILLAALIVGSGLGLYYYLRVMVALYDRNKNTEKDNLPVGRASVAIVIVLVALVLWLGVYPQPALEFINTLH